MKKKNPTQLKKELDKLVSEFVRRSNADYRGYVTCYTCSKPMLWQESQCGHFVSRVYLNTRFNLRNLKVQCVGCNVFGNGKIPIFAEKLEKEEKGITTFLYREANKIVKDFPYQQRIDEFKERLANLTLK